MDLKLVWGLDTATFAFFPPGHVSTGGAWWLVFVDDSDQANALAYHDLTDDGLPMSKVFVKTILADKASLSVGATHEVCEMAVDPWLNKAYQDPTGMFWAGEICDPVEDDRYGYEISGIPVTDFVTPGWFAHTRASGPIDFKQRCRNAFEVLTGGYAQRFDLQQGWVQVTGAIAKWSKRAPAPVGSRRERRARNRNEWKLSAPRRTPQATG